MIDILNDFPDVKLGLADITDDDGRGSDDMKEGSMDSYKVEQLKKMLKHETSKTEEHYGARLSHWHGDTNMLTIDAGGLRALIRHYSKHDTNR